MADQYFSPAKQEPSAIPFRNKFDGARDPLTARNAIGALGEAPADGQQYAREDGAWTVISAPDTATVTAPQGRVTLATGTPVMTASQTAKTTIYYSPYTGVLVPIYDGASFTMTAFSELSVATTDTAKSPAAIGAGKINDWFVWSDSGTIRIGHGPDWTSDTARSAGTALTLVNGIWLNNAAITNGPAALRGSYVGTTRSDASSQLNWQLPSAASGGGAGILAIWNAYNRVMCGGTNEDTTSTWNYAAASFRVRNSSANNSVSFVAGLQEDTANIVNAGYGSNGGAHVGIIGIGVDSTSALVGPGAQNASGSGVASSMAAAYSATSFGYHVWYAVEGSNGAGGVTFVGTVAGPTRNLSSLTFWFLM